MFRKKNLIGNGKIQTTFVEIGFSPSASNFEIVAGSSRKSILVPHKTNGVLGQDFLTSNNHYRILKL